jgi:glycosyltransferase involved in cell wall biosynthesis
LVMNKKLVFVVNNSAFFVSHRLKLGIAAKNAGYDVTVLAPNNQQKEKIEAAGLRLESYYLQRKSINPFTEFISLISLFLKLKQLRPDVIHGVSLKACIYTSIIGRVLKIGKLVQSITGLGYVFIDESAKARAIRSIAGAAFKLAFRDERIKVIFQNNDDQQMFIKNHWLKESQCVMIRGAGVDTKAFKPSAEPNGKPVKILFPARLLKDKGILEFVAACRNLLDKKVEFEGLIAGGLDPGNPNALEKDVIHSWRDEKVVTWLGHVEDMPECLKGVHIVCLPSYREGLPLALAEAAAAGKPIVTTDVPGCRDVVTDGKNGFLVPAHDFNLLAQKLEQLIKNPELRKSMGREGRKIAEESLSSDYVISETLKHYS